MKWIIFVFLFFTHSLLFAQIKDGPKEGPSTLDKYLRNRIEFFEIRPMEKFPQNSNRPQIELGKRLFMETNLSGNRNMSCLSCHNPKTGTSDLLPLSKTENNKGILARNSQSLFNLGGHSVMFWDGRVQYDKINKVFKTPEINLSPEISNVMTSALSAQALFPLVSESEMKGRPGENEIADAKNNSESWQRIVIRLKNDKNSNSHYQTYSDLFKQAFPGTDPEKINIGHVAEAIAAFEKEEFQSTGSPFNQYLKGDNAALTEKQKRGFDVFLSNGCIACHQGGELGNNTFFTSVGVPAWGKTPVTPDLGRGDIIQDPGRNYFFRTPSLLNISQTAPYMHNGAFQTIREVINHYNDIRSSLDGYTIPEGRAGSMPVPVSVDRDPAHLTSIWNSIQAGFLKAGLALSDQNKDDLEAFLSEALTDPAFQTR